MSALNGLLAEFESASELVAAARTTHRSGYNDIEAYSPFPVHGLGEAIGFTKNRVPLVVLIVLATTLCAGESVRHQLERKQGDTGLTLMNKFLVT